MDDPDPDGLEGERRDALQSALEIILLTDLRTTTPAEQLQTRAQDAAQEIDKHLQTELETAPPPAVWVSVFEEVHLILLRIADGR
jgi:hypothetical protein